MKMNNSSIVILSRQYLDSRSGSPASKKTFWIGISFSPSLVRVIPEIIDFPLVTGCHPICGHQVIWIDAPEVAQREWAILQHSQQWPPRALTCQQTPDLISMLSWQIHLTIRNWYPPAWYTAFSSSDRWSAMIFGPLIAVTSLCAPAATPSGVVQSLRSTTVTSLSTLCRNYSSLRVRKGGKVPWLVDLVAGERKWRWMIPHLQEYLTVTSQHTARSTPNRACRNFSV